MATSTTSFIWRAVYSRVPKRQVVNCQTVPSSATLLDQMSLKDKIVPSESLADWRQRLRAEGRRLVVTNGCFDLLHAGHVIYLETARGFGDALLIGLNSDESVRELKGEGRPLNTASDRAIVLAGLESVTAVTVFPDTLAARFLSVAQPDVYVKGGDYTLDTLNAEEKEIVESAGGRVELVSFVPGKSTTRLIDTIHGR
jgi:rfaE bifunctional protein nucleotidyltransferase chain/domain